MDSGGWVALGTVVTGLIGAVVVGIVQIMKTRHDNTKDTESTVVKELRQLIDTLRSDQERMEHEQEKLQEKMEAVTADHHRCERMNERMLARIEYLTGLLEDAGKKPRPWDPDPGSGVHRPIQDRRHPPQPDPKYKGPKRRVGDQDVTDTLTDDH